MVHGSAWVGVLLGRVPGLACPSLGAELGPQWIDTQAVAEVAEPLLAAALIAVVGQHRAQHVDQLVTGDVLGEHVVEANPTGSGREVSIPAFPYTRSGSFRTLWASWCRGLC